MTAAIQGGFYLADRYHPQLWAWCAGFLALLGGASLVIGFLTPIIGGVVGIGVLGVAFSRFPPPTPNLFDAPLPAILVVIVAAALVLLGPGAFSLDARLFGRREIIIPHAPRSPRP